MNRFQIKQDELNNFVIRERGIEIHENSNSMSRESYLNNMLLACLDEVYEVMLAPFDMEEYIDVAHFVMTIANIYNLTLLTPDKMADYYGGADDVGMAKNLELALLQVIRKGKSFKHWSNSRPSRGEIVTQIWGLLDVMMNIIYCQLDRHGMSFEEEYDKKYQINIQRQKENY